MRIRSIISFLSLLILISCSPSQKEKSATLAIKGDQLEEAEISTENAENNLVQQLDEYLVAFHKGDTDKAIEYIYPAMFEYFHQEYPERFSVSKFKNVMRKTIEESKQSIAKADMEMSIEIGQISDRQDLGKRKIYTVMTFVKGKNEKDEISMGGEVFGITHDYGQTWKFIQKEKETSPGILAINFSDNVISDVMESNTLR